MYNKLDYLEKDQKEVLIDNAICVADSQLEIHLNILKENLSNSERHDNWKQEDCLFVRTSMQSVYRYMRSMGFITWEEYDNACEEVNNTIKKVCYDLGLDDICF